MSFHRKSHKNFVAYICSLPRDQGVRCGSSTLTRYYFNVATRNCETMTFNGCEGNRNNFATLTQCLNYCNSAGCAAGQIALQVNTLLAQEQIFNVASVS